MNKITDRLRAHARIYPIKEPNRIKTITKLPNGDLEVTQNSGNVFTIAAEDELLQAFVVFTVLNPECEHGPSDS